MRELLKRGARVEGANIKVWKTHKTAATNVYMQVVLDFMK